MTPREAIRRLRREGWMERPGKGSHTIFKKDRRRAVVSNHALPDYDRTGLHDPRSFLVPVETTGRAPRVNISLDEGLPARIDDASKRTGLSRSALLARGARMPIATEVNA